MEVSVPEKTKAEAAARCQMLNAKRSRMLIKAVLKVHDMTLNISHKNNTTLYTTGGGSAGS